MDAAKGKYAAYPSSNTSIRCSTLLRYCFRQLRSTQVAILHCSAQTTPVHVIQKLNQSCIQVSSTNGRTYRPKDCENLILYVKDINLPKLDKWGTSQLIEFFQQVSDASERLAFVRQGHRAVPRH